MKKLLLLLLTSSSFYANTIKITEKELTDDVKLEIAETQGRCAIIRKNIYNDCVNHGFTADESSFIANAAKSKCIEIGQD